jgi:hypothetical protein
MNIFILSEQIKPADHYRQQAEYHIDRHVIKMIAESTQMLVTTLYGPHLDGLPVYIPDGITSFPCNPLSASMRKHPCTIWAGKSVSNFNYLACLALSLCKEHQYRYPLSPEHTYMPWLKNLVSYLETWGYGMHEPIPTSFAVAVKDQAVRSTDTDHITALDIYRDYYVRDKWSFATWKKRQKPVWFMLREEAHEQLQILKGKK